MDKIIWEDVPDGTPIRDARGLVAFKDGATHRVATEPPSAPRSPDLWPPIVAMMEDGYREIAFPPPLLTVGEYATKDNWDRVPEDAILYCDPVNLWAQAHEGELYDFIETSPARYIEPRPLWNEQWLIKAILAPGETTEPPPIPAGTAYRIKFGLWGKLPSYWSGGEIVTLASPGPAGGAWGRFTDGTRSCPLGFDDLLPLEAGPDPRFLNLPDYLPVEVRAGKASSLSNRDARPLKVVYALRGGWTETLHPHNPRVNEWPLTWEFSRALDKERRGVW